MGTQSGRRGALKKRVVVGALLVRGARGPGRGRGFQSGRSVTYQRAA